MNRSTKWLLIALLAVNAVWLASFLLDVRLKANPQQFGLLSLRGHYRGLFLSWCDGWWPVRGELRPVVLNPDGSLGKVGYRWVPRLYYLSMPGWHEDKFAR